MDSWFEGAREPRESRSRFRHAGMGFVRITLLFGSAAIALALVLTPVLERRMRDVAINGIGLDRMPTGSVEDRKGHIFTVRRSILQPMPDSICVIRENGARGGSC